MLFSESINSKLQPLAERIRPQTLDGFVGQHDLIHDQSLLKKAISSNTPFSIIFWGPPGTGKTSLARILSNEFKVNFFELSAISSGVKEVRKILDQGKLLFDSGKRSILFIDEIHRFTKSQQDALLNAVENGSIILIGATTENPSFEVISPLLSRCRLLKLKPLNNSDLDLLVQKAITDDKICSEYKISIDLDAKTYLIQSSGGDARKMLNTLELSISLKNSRNLTLDHIKQAIQQKSIIYDKSGDYHYDVISAFIKSVRGSDPDAAIYWLAVMLEGGEKPEFIARRLVILASEDVGNAEPYALQLSNSALDAVNKIGMPESRIILSQITIYLSVAPKSNASKIAIDLAIKNIKENGSEPVPVNLRNNNTHLKNQNDDIFYKDIYSSEKNFIEQNYFPNSFEVKPIFYKPKDEGREMSLKLRLKDLWKDRYK